MYDTTIGMVNESELLQMAYDIERKIEGLNENEPVPTNIEAEVRAMAKEMLRKLD